MKERKNMMEEFSWKDFSKGTSESSESRNCKKVEKRNMQMQ